MNCETKSLVLNEALDGELSTDDRAAMDRHLDECLSCRDYWMELQNLDRELRSTLQPSSMESSIENILQAVANLSANHNDGIIGESSHAVIRSTTDDRPLRRHLPGASQHRPTGILLAVLCMVLMTSTLMLQWPLRSNAVAEIALSTGSVDIQHADSRDWIAVDGRTRVKLAAHTRVRTQPKSLCEIHTKSDAIVRLNQRSEVVLHLPERVELVAGELWCRAAEQKRVEICSSDSARTPQNKQIFSCPTSTEMQWRTLPNQEVSCLDVSTTPIEVEVQQTICTIQPGECLTFQSGHPQPNPTRSNILIATNWQLPLLAMKNPDDSELQRRLTNLLALAGRAKLASMYENEIRQLGPVGALPLLAYVRSSDSRQDTPSRYRAMSIASDIAPDSCIPDLKALLDDDDPNIRRLALHGLMRLQPAQKTSVE